MPTSAQDRVTDLQSGYDRIAQEYARRIYGELAHKPLDRSLLDRFAETVRDAGVTCDLGCGPGHVARYLHERGVRVCGVDLSRRMVDCARHLNPGIPFSQGDMRALPVENTAWSGIAAFYSIVNLPHAVIVEALHEMARVLEPGGRLFLAFHTGEDTLHKEEDLWGSGVTLEVNLFRVSTIAGLMQAAGFHIDEVVEREPYAPDVEYQSRRAYIFAHKPGTKTASE
jgi:SAM-dependent methyltransferase